MKSEPQSPLCYTCKFRENVLGDAHSCCKHPSVRDEPILTLIAILAGRVSVNAKALNIKGNPHGIQHGWFFWPSTFDPIWLENCDGYEGRK
jgi:hypothetical protein